ncbi:hypothetical protein [Pelistega ratti]|uniref:hypothetical protein n=1 Tax=Pelistega ratti TaxID=2652177 RepID=UPI00135ADE83|nr:hypothetical protein [Pelistega ratti]
MMKKKVLLWCMVLSSVMASAVAQEVDNRPASQKAQDVYVEPTLRMTQTQTIGITDDKTQQVSVVGVETKTSVIDHQGNVIESSEERTDVQPIEQKAIPQVPAQKAPIEKAITDKSRSMP